MPASNAPGAPDLNRPALRRLIAHLKKPSTRDHFDMATWFSARGIGYQPGDKSIGELAHACGTAACLAGHAAILAQPQRKAIRCDSNITYVARDWLGLSGPAARDLFLGENSYGILLEHLTLDEAIATLEHLDETGFVEWQIDPNADREPAE